jgi:flavin reductase (DIM6/NTAB) family NADH-FMN oxidoreductase RutF
MTIDLKEITNKKRQDYLNHAVAPRPIALVSTINGNGQPNLSPFSFFNLFSISPPIVIFSPSRRLRDNTTKHTYENLFEVPEAVINIVDYDIVQQMSLASCEYPADTNEFIKAGFTEEPATIVRPPMVKESKIKLECRLKGIKPLGNSGGAGNLIIAEILRIHIDDNILDEEGMIDQRKINHVARLGGDWYCKVDKSNLFKVPKPNRNLGIGMDALPSHIRHSKILTGNDLALLAGVERMPELNPFFFIEKPDHEKAKKMIAQGRVHDAWQILLHSKKIYEDRFSDKRIF